MEPVLIASSIVILLFSVIVHEVMHGVMALKFGDRTAQNAGRLTLNPLPHIDPIGTIILPILLVLSGSPILFGWAKPVPVNPLNFRDIRKGELWTASAGVLANFSLALFATLILHLTSSFSGALIESVLRFAIYINLVLAIFNSLPIPPLDGSKILQSYLPSKYQGAFREFEKYGFFILLFLLLFPFGGGSILGTILSFFLSIFQSLLRL